MGPRHTSLQLLGGDWLIRIPMLYLTAEDTRKTTQKQGSATDAPRLPETPWDYTPSQSENHCLLLAPTSGPLGQGQARAASELPQEGGCKGLSQSGGHQGLTRAWTKRRKSWGQLSAQSKEEPDLPHRRPHGQWGAPV